MTIGYAQLRRYRPNEEATEQRRLLFVLLVVGPDVVLFFYSSPLTSASIGVDTAAAAKKQQRQQKNRLVQIVSADDCARDDDDDIITYYYLMFRFSTVPLVRRALPATNCTLHGTTNRPRRLLVSPKLFRRLPSRPNANTSQPFQSICLRVIITSGYVSNDNLHKDLNNPHYTQFFSILRSRTDPLITQIFPTMPRRLKRQWPRDLLNVYDESKIINKYISTDHVLSGGTAGGSLPINVLI